MLQRTKQPFSDTDLAAVDLLLNTAVHLCSDRRVSTPHPSPLKQQLLRTLEANRKMRPFRLLTPLESAQVELSPDGKITGPSKILAKLLRKLKKPA